MRNRLLRSIRQWLGASVLTLGMAATLQACEGDEQVEDSAELPEDVISAANVISDNERAGDAHLAADSDTSHDEGFSKMSDGIAMSPAQLRDFLSGKRITRPQGSGTPIVFEQYDADGTWSSTVEAVMPSVLSGTWRTEAAESGATELCVTVTERHPQPMTERYEMCRSVAVDETRTMLRLSDHNNRNVVASFDIVDAE